jgi:tungstate transport system substrate-binding protein
MKKWLLLILLSFLFLVPGLCWAQKGGFVFMASTIGPIDSGIVGALEDQFEKETGVRVRHIGAGTGAALKIAEKGNIDLVMAHAKSLEEKFIAEGYGTERIPLMYNDFVILGPARDPAGIKGKKSGAEALKTIAAKQTLFITRGDKSGTHVAEMEIWAKEEIKPAGSWYVTYEKGTEGNVPTTRFADSKEAYVFMDRATYLALKKEINLVILVENDEALLNYISLIPVDPKKFPRVNHLDTMTFVNWLTDPAKGQKIIAEFGKDKYGAPLFFANSKEWQATHKK